MSVSLRFSRPSRISYCQAGVGRPKLGCWVLRPAVVGNEFQGLVKSASSPYISAQSPDSHCETNNSRGPPPTDSSCRGPEKPFIYWSWSLWIPGQRTLYPFQDWALDNHLSASNNSWIPSISGASYLTSVFVFFVSPSPFILSLLFFPSLPPIRSFLSLTKCNSWSLDFADGPVFYLPHFSCFCCAAFCCFSRPSSQPLSYLCPFLTESFRPPSPCPA